MFQRLIILQRRLVASAVIWSFINTALRAGANLFLLPLVLKILPPEQLGLWYLFGSVGALIIVLDVGFAPSAARAVSYLWAGSSTILPFGVAEKIPDASGPNLELLTKLLASLKILYASLAGITVLLLGVFGTYYIHYQIQKEGISTHLLICWGLYIISVSYSLYATFWMAALPGVGGMTESVKSGIYGHLVNVIVSIAGLLIGFGFYSLVLANLLGTIVSRYCAIRAVSQITGIKKIHISEARKDLLSTLWPQSWRNAIGTVGAYMIGQGGTIICASVLGLREAASYALTLQLVGFILGLSGVFIDVKFPQITSMRVHGSKQEIAELFISRMRIATLTLCFGTMPILLFGNQLLAVLGSETELLPLVGVIIVVIDAVVMLTYSRCAHLTITLNENPYILLNLAAGAAVMALGYLGATWYGLVGLVASKLFVILTFCSWWMTKKGLSSINLSIPRYLLAIMDVRKLLFPRIYPQ